ncbi:hypothetical protein [Candidatus Marithrix sp. Canyon 246]|uniref:hypothetical protein n=1 Tax=Candidatus Marithrix sp. Canyon 246 TaxID=1827136 RepID=UPI00084A1741|nr:hypothetical protein [Candidatus Marithrix sp. Canyon 246]
MIKQTSIKIATVGMDKQMLRILEMVFDGPGKGDYILVNKLEEAQACIFDLDNLEGMKSWKDYRNSNLKLPTIILSLNYKDIAGTTFVKKPIKINDLLKNLIKITNSTVSAPQKSVQKESNSKIHQRKSISNNAELITETSFTEQNATQLYGNNEDINLNNKEEIDKLFYDTSEYLQGYFEYAFGLSQKLETGGLLIEGLYCPVILIARQNRILRSNAFNDNQLRTMTLLPLSNITVRHDKNHGKALKVHLNEKHGLNIVNLNESELAQYQKQYNLNPHNLDGILWLIALWTARGRLPADTDLNKPVILRNWPNFTRLIKTPYALKIAAFWISNPHSLVETARILDIPQRYVFAFFNAAHAIRLASTNSNFEASSSTTANVAKKHAKRGLFQLILTKLLN